MTDTTASGNNEDSLSEPGLDKQTVTNDAVAGEPVNPTGHYAGPTGSEPLEAEPVLHEHGRIPESIDLDDGE